MKITRPDTTSMILAAICVVGIVILSLLHVAIPDVLAFATLTALGIGGGTSLNTPSPASDSAAQRIAGSLASLEQLLGAARRPASTPAPAAARIPTQQTAPAAAPAGSAQ